MSAAELLPVVQSFVRDWEPMHQADETSHFAWYRDRLFVQFVRGRFDFHLDGAFPANLKLYTNGETIQNDGENISKPDAEQLIKEFFEQARPL
jgi:hypothetical protein